MDALKKFPAPAVLIVGGGINGISLYRELALQGVNVVLAERGDFCVGASAALSRMVHGGLRYMEQGDFKLVREALQERNLLLKNAPHYVFPLATTIPIFERFSGITNSVKKFLGMSEKPSRRGALIIKAGLTLYDFFTQRNQVMPSHKFYKRAETFHNWPDFDERVICSATYYDAWITYPERLGLEMITDMNEFEETAQAFNYLNVEQVEDGKVVLKDLINGEKISLEPQVVVNATGAWIDFTNARLKGPEDEIDANRTNLVGGTKGSHLIVNNAQLFNALGDQMVYYENHEGRICILFRYFNNVLIGSTDIKIDTPEDIRCEAEEQDYILQSLSCVFPDIKILPDQILYRFSGVRPLVNSSSAVTGQISREHYCETIPKSETTPFPTVCLIGGKWTTFRAFGEQAADHVLDLLGVSRTISTTDLAIGGGKSHPLTNGGIENWVKKHARTHEIEESRLKILLERYGTSSIGFVNSITDESDVPLENHSGYSKAEIRHIIRHERVESLSDILFRRTALAISGELNMLLIDEILDILALEKSWADDKKSDERTNILWRLSHFHGLSEANLATRQFS